MTTAHLRPSLTEVAALVALSPMAQELRADVEGVSRDGLVALFDELAARAGHACRKPQSAVEFEANSALMDAATLAREIVTVYWARHHLND
ncbi:MAG TPA: hypothetical protein VLC92_06535 [Rhodocyclaceae bacterium]|nr:hypothetical protein [Rhodocyclaceae bacterium]